MKDRKRKVKVINMKMGMRNKTYVSAMVVVMIIGLIFMGFFTAQDVSAARKTATKVKNLKVRVYRQTLKASWRKSKGARKYQVFIKKGKKWRKSRTLKRTSVILKFEKPMTSYIKVRGIAKRKGKFSRAVKFTIRKTKAHKRSVKNPVSNTQPDNLSASVTVYGKTIKIDESMTDVEKKLGKNYEIKKTDNMLTWHVYNAYSNQGNLLCISFYGGKVFSIYTNATGFRYEHSFVENKTGTRKEIRIEEGEICQNFGYSEFISAKPFVDKYDDNRVIAIIAGRTMKSDSAYRILSNESEKNDFEDLMVDFINGIRSRANANNLKGINNRPMLGKDKKAGELARDRVKGADRYSRSSHSEFSEMAGESEVFGEIRESYTSGIDPFPFENINKLYNESKDEYGRTMSRDYLLDPRYTKVGVGCHGNNLEIIFG